MGASRGWGGVVVAEVFADTTAWSFARCHREKLTIAAEASTYLEQTALVT